MSTARPGWSMAGSRRADPGGAAGIRQAGLLVEHGAGHSALSSPATGRAGMKWLLAAFSLIIRSRRRSRNSEAVRAESMQEIVR